MKRFSSLQPPKMIIIIPVKMTKGATTDDRRRRLVAYHYPVAHIGGPRRNGKFNRIPGDFNNWTVNSIYIHIDWYRLLKKTQPKRKREGRRTPIRDRKDSSSSGKHLLEFHTQQPTNHPPLYSTLQTTTTAPGVTGPHQIQFLQWLQWVLCCRI